MAILLEVDYFNSYWVKKLTGSGVPYSGANKPVDLPDVMAINPGVAYPGITKTSEKNF